MAPAQPQPTDGARSPDVTIASIDPEILTNPAAVCRGGTRFRFSRPMKVWARVVVR